MDETLVLEGRRCVGVRYSVAGQKRETRASREVIVCPGSINSPKLLELSGIGQADRLRGLGIQPVHELKGVGENLRDHYSPRVKFAITAPNFTFNDNARGWRLAREALKYALWGEGFLATTSVPIRMYFRTRPGLETPDATVSILPFLYNVWKTAKYGKPVGVDDPWGYGASLEWATSCPPPRHNFLTLPRIRSESPAFDLHHPGIAALEQLEYAGHGSAIEGSKEAGK